MSIVSSLICEVIMDNIEETEIEKWGRVQYNAQLIQNYVMFLLERDINELNFKEILALTYEFLGVDIDKLDKEISLRQVTYGNCEK